MSSRWPHIPLREVLSKNEQWVSLDPATEYREVTVRLWGRGVVLRALTSGSEIAAASRVRVRAGQFILSRIDARNGASGIVPANLDGAVVSGDFPTFDINTDCMMPEFLGWFARTGAFVEMCRKASEGTTNRMRLKEEKFLHETIPLPPVREQQRLVARLNSVAARVAEASANRDSSGSMLRRVLASVAAVIFADGCRHAVHRRFGDFLPHVTSGPRSWSDRCRPQAALRFYRAQDICGNGSISDSDAVFIDPPDSNQGATARLQNGDLLIVITGATVGRVGLFEPHHLPGYVSQHVALCRLPPAAIVPRFAHWWLRSRDGSQQLLRQRYGQGKPGLNLSNIRALTIPVPSMDTQTSIVKRLDFIETRVNEAVSLHDDLAARYAALQPSVLNRAFAGVL